jgi:hypothetical protein
VVFWSFRATSQQQVGISCRPGFCAAQASKVSGRNAGPAFKGTPEIARVSEPQHSGDIGKTGAWIAQQAASFVKTNRIDQLPVTEAGFPQPALQRTHRNTQLASCAVNGRVTRR